jgi:ABC-type branched-subunit amino acid transport system substrate-binding protein
LRFRVWLRRGPTGERAISATAAVLLAALVVWALVPLGQDDGGDSPEALAAGGTTAASAATAGSPTSPEVTPGAAVTATPVAGQPGVASSSQTPGAAQAAVAGADRCAGLGASDQGVTKTEIFVAVSEINLAGQLGNSLFGLRGNLDEVVNAAVAAVNAEGGVACRKLRVKIYKTNPIDPNEQRSTCLQIAGDKPFAVIDVFGFANPASRGCLIDSKIPFQGSSTLSEDEAQKNYPYLFSTRVSNTRAAKTWVAENVALGSFDASNGFKKLGVAVDECDPQANGELLAALDRAGVHSDRRAVFTLRGCGVSSPADISQAMVQHRNAGATHVFLGGQPTDMQNYVRQADGVGWKPTYMLSDYGSLSSIYDWSAGFDGTRAITSLRSGEIASGIPNPNLDRCNEWMKKSGVAPQTSETDVGPGFMCDQFRLFVAAANAAGNALTRNQLVPSLTKIGRFPGTTVSDGLFDRPRKLFGGDFVRRTEWQAGCKCWKALDRDMRLGRT